MTNTFPEPGNHKPNHMHTTTRSLALASALSLGCLCAHAQVQLPADHVDFGIGYDAGALALHWHDESSATEYAPHEAFAFIPLSSSANRPAGAQWNFTGTSAGSPVYLAPAIQAPGVIFLGIGSEEIPTGTFTADTLSLELVSLSGPGQFSLWQTDAFSSPVVALSTASAVTSFTLTTGGHSHYNWGFTAPGIYELEFRVTGTLTGEVAPISDTATFAFGVGAVIPEPGTVALALGAGVLGFALVARRRQQRA